MAVDAPRPVEPTIPRPSVLRRVAPWFIGLVILALIATRVPVAAFREAIGHGPHLRLALVTLGTTVLVLCTDTFSTWVGLLALRVRRPIQNVLVVRGASYVLFLLNYALGQGVFGYYLVRTGLEALRAVGVTLFLVGTNLAMLLVVTTVAWLSVGGDATYTALWWILVGGCGAFAVYLVVITIAPAFIAKVRVLTPLFDAGLRGHAVAVLGRLPHVASVVLQYWIAMRAWGIPVPFVTGVTLMPVVAIAAVLPISPAGLGTTQAALVYFFSAYAAGATTDDRHAHVLAFAVVYFVYTVVSVLLVGLVCTPFAKRLGVLPQTATTDAG